jgi:hypothetical protein
MMATDMMLYEKVYSAELYARMQVNDLDAVAVVIEVNQAACDEGSDADVHGVSTSQLVSWRTVFKARLSIVFVNTTVRHNEQMEEVLSNKIPRETRHARTFVQFKPIQTHAAVLSCLLAFDILHKCFPHLEESHPWRIIPLLSKLFLRSKQYIHSSISKYDVSSLQSLPMRYMVLLQTVLCIYNNAITAPTTPNNPTPTFTVPAALFPLAVAAAALPLLVAVELADVFDPVTVVFASLVFFAPLLALVLPVVLALPVLETEPEAEVEGTAEETVLVESMVNWFE